MPWTVRFTQSARLEVMDLWNWGEAHFGQVIADALDDLIQTATDDLREDPFRLGSRAMPARSDDLRVYPIAFSRRRGDRIGHVDHAIYYFVLDGRRVLVVSVAHPRRATHIDALTASDTDPSA